MTHPQGLSLCSLLLLSLSPLRALLLLTPCEQTFPKSCLLPFSVPNFSFTSSLFLYGLNHHPRQVTPQTTSPAPCSLGTRTPASVVLQIPHAQGGATQCPRLPSDRTRPPEEGGGHHFQIDQTPLPILVTLCTCCLVLT